MKAWKRSRAVISPQNLWNKYAVIRSPPRASTPGAAESNCKFAPAHQTGCEWERITWSLPPRDDFVFDL